MCSRGCGVELGIGSHLLGTAKEWMILHCYSCNSCSAVCAVEGCVKLPQTDCNGHCLGHATQEQRDTINDERKKKSK